MFDDFEAEYQLYTQNFKKIFLQAESIQDD